MSDFKEKYLKYKKKYLDLKEQIGGEKYIKSYLLKCELKSNTDERKINTFIQISVIENQYLAAIKGQYEFNIEVLHFGMNGLERIDNFDYPSSAPMKLVSPFITKMDGTPNTYIFHDNYNQNYEITPLQDIHLNFTYSKEELFNELYDTMTNGLNSDYVLKSKIGEEYKRMNFSYFFENVFPKLQNDYKIYK